MKFTWEPLKALFKKAGLDEPASVEEGIAALTDMVSKANESETQIAALTDQVNQAKDQEPDPAKYVPIDVAKGLQAQLAALTDQFNGKTVEQTVEQAIADGKLLPAQKAWATKLGQSNMVALTDYIGSTPVIAALTDQQTDKSGKKPEDTGTVALTDEESSIAKAMGMTEKEFIAAKEADKTGA